MPRSRVRDMRIGHAWTWLRRAGMVALAVLLIEYLAIPRIVEATSDLTLFADASPVLLAAAFVLEAASLASYTALSRAVLSSTTRPRYADQLRIDLTGLGVSHVIPGGGASATALRFRLMSQWGVPATEVAATTAVQTALVVMGLLALFVGGVVLAGRGVVDHPAYAAGGAAAAALLGAAAWVLHRQRGRRPAPPGGPFRPLTWPSRFLGPRASSWVARSVAAAVATAHTTAGRVALLARDPRLSVSVLGWATGNWVFDAASLWVCLRAYDLDIGPGALLMGYGAANLIGLLPVTPGGIGLVEGVLIPALTTLGSVAAAPVTLGVLTWRLFEFWLPIPIGGLAYLSLNAQRLLPRFLPRGRGH